MAKMNWNKVNQQHKIKNGYENIGDKNAGTHNSFYSARKCTDKQYSYLKALLKNPKNLALAKIYRLLDKEGTLKKQTDLDLDLMKRVIEVFSKNGV